MTDTGSTRDAPAERSAARRQHAPADVAPELYDATDDSTADPR